MRKIVKIDQAKCNGCGECVVNCPEGALQIINGKARLVKEVTVSIDGRVIAQRRWNSTL